MLQKMAVVAIAVVLLPVTVSLADTLRLRDGSSLEGTFLGGDSRTVRFLGADGQMATYNLADVESIGFGGAPAPVPAPAPARGAASSPPPAAPGNVHTIPRDTVIVVRTIDSINSDANQPGETFRATLEEPLVVDGHPIVPKHAPALVRLVSVKQSGQLRGSEEIALQLHTLTIDGRSHTVSSRYAEVASEGKGKQTAKVIGGTTAVGAVIGAIAGGGKGAAVGAASGAGAGAAVQTLRGKTVKVPPETVLAFRLDEPLAIR